MKRKKKRKLPEEFPRRDTIRDLEDGMSERPSAPLTKLHIYIYRANMVSHNTHIHTYTYFNQYTPSYISRKIHQPHHRRRPWDQEMQRRGRSEEGWNGNDGEREKGLGLLGALSSDRQTGTVWRQL